MSGMGRSQLPHLDETPVATTRYLAGLTALDESSVRMPSELPGWTRAHVVGHVARNADGLAGMLVGARTGEDLPMYPSQDHRDADIERTAGLPWAELLDDAHRSARRWAAAAEALPDHRLDAPVRRTPGAEPFPVRRVGVLRRTEVEVHHADLRTGYAARHWPPDFVEVLMRRRDRELREAGVGLTLVAEDLGRTWETGPGPTVSGRAADLLWWLLGRGAGEGLVCSDGALPDLGGWA
jgi:maleylpyruvate isomerase